MGKKLDLWGYIWILPFMAGFAVFYIFPAAQAFQAGFLGKGFTGFENLIRLFNNKAFQLAGINTLKFDLLAIPLLMLVSLVTAILLGNRKNGLARNMLLIPLCIPTASVIAFWSLIFGEKGLLDPLIELFKLPYTDFINSPYAFYILILLFIWKYSGYSMLMWLIGLNAIPKEYYESASLDGAGAIRQFFSITLPMLKPAALLVFIISLINTFKVYREAYMLAGEYPDKSIYLLQHFMNNIFKQFNYPNLVMTSFVIVVSILFIFVTGRFIFYKKGES